MLGARSSEAVGTQTSTAVTPFQLQRTTTGARLLAVDRLGRYFLAQSEGPTTGLYEYGPKGGTPKLLAAGKFLEPKRNN